MSLRKRKQASIESFFQTGKRAKEEEKSERVLNECPNEFKQKEGAAQDLYSMHGKEEETVEISVDDCAESKSHEQLTHSNQENNQIVDVYGMHMIASWNSILSEEISKPYFKQLMAFIETRRKSGKIIYPPTNLIFSALNECPLHEIKVVIIGQDPYHGPNQAHGMSFSVLPGIQHPPSLRNMIKEAVSDVGIRSPPKKYGYLLNWSRQGVLMLNAVLTVERGSANSHAKKGWEKFTDAIISIINRQSPGAVFILWGKPAQTKCRSINRSKHRIICSSHPSPLSATKTNEPFIGSKCYSRANTYLEELGHAPVDWEICS